MVYALDRATGEFLWARPTIMQNVITSIDGATGKVTVNPETTFSKFGETHMVCPGAQGGKNWPAGAYNPRMNAMFMPMQNLCGRDGSVRRRELSASRHAGVETEHDRAGVRLRAAVVAAISHGGNGANRATYRVRLAYWRQLVRYGWTRAGDGLR